MSQLEHIDNPERDTARPGKEPVKRKRVDLRSDRETPAVTPIRPPEETAAPPKPRATRKIWARRGLFALLPIALAVGADFYVTGGALMSTDDAYVEADTVGVSTDVSGIVSTVDVTENQHVTKGQILYRLDPTQYRIALNNAQANLAQTRLTIEAMKRDYQRMLQDIDTQRAVVSLDQVTFNRDAALTSSEAVAQSTYDQARFTLQSDRSKLNSLQQQAQVQLAKLAGNPDIPVTQHPQYLQGKAQVDEAQRELDHTVVRAPFAGVVTGVPATQPGEYLQASVAAFHLVATDHVWVDADPKETALTYVRAGQPATITVDTYPDLQWRGQVESVSPAAAQQFQLLPAQNTSGNWVKVVQRVPIRVRVDTGNASEPHLRAGMSVEVDVDTGHERGFPHFLTAIVPWLGSGR